MLSIATSTGNAQPLPGGTPVKIDGERRQCYDLEQYRDLLKFQSACTACNEQRSLLERKDALHETFSAELLRINELLSANVATLQKERNRLFDDWKRENKLRHEAENRVGWSSWVGWGVAAIATTTAVTLAITR